MSSAKVALNPDAAAGAVKRKAEEAPEDQPELKKSAPNTTPLPEDAPPTTDPAKAISQPLTKAREIRLDQNRKAARESRRRKKVMIEELQRSVIFFSRANGTLKQQNDELSRLLFQAQAQAKAAGAKDIKEGGDVAPVSTEVASSAKATDSSEPSHQEQQAHAQAVATQALFESQGFPAAAARAAAQTMNASGSSTSNPMLSMQPGSTMQAMANFQQAAASAMQAAIQGMSSIPNVNMALMTAGPPAGSNAQQAYTDTMTALAMQQAAAAHLGNQFASMGASAFITNPMMNWATSAAAPVAEATKTEDNPAADEPKAETDSV